MDETRGEVLAEGCAPCGVSSRVTRLQWDGERLGAGGNSGFQALNLAAVCGAKRVILTGFDMGRAAGSHWHGDHGAGLNNPDDGLLSRCATLLDASAPEFEARGVEVLNASRETALKAFRRVKIEEALD